MNRINSRAWVVAAVFGVTVTAMGWSSRAQEPTTTEKIKQKVGGAVDSIKKGAATGADVVKEKYKKAKDSVVALEIEGRVYARLHWDKALIGSKVELKAPKSGIIELHGTVSSAKAKAKAIELAQDTVGVNDVVDSLIVQASPSAITTPAK
jgi:hyperosmotically inducible protein